LPLLELKFLLPPPLPELGALLTLVAWLDPGLPAVLALWLPLLPLELALRVEPPPELRPPPELELWLPPELTLWLLPELKLWRPPELELGEE
jgi:hypothetical protein